MRSQILIATILLSTSSLFAADIEVFRGARILTATDATYDPGTLVIQGGKITAIGKQSDIDIPDGAKIHDVQGKVMIPGLVDTHSHLGVASRPRVDANRDNNEMTGPVQSIVRALDSLNPFDPGFRMATAGGVTTANIMPGSGNVIGGQTIYVKLRGYSAEQMWINSPDVYGGLKMANGENPKRVYGSQGKAPATRMKIAALQRAEYIKAQSYVRKWADYRKKLAAGEDVTAPDVDISMEPLAEVLERKRTVHFHTHRADDILTVLRLKREFGFELVIQHGTEAFKVLDEIAKAQVPVSMTIVDSPGGKAEVVDFIEETGNRMHKKGIKVLVNTDDPVTESRFFLRTAAIAVRGGLPEDAALKSITINGAEAMHLEHRLGSLETGKDADFVILSGAPFSVYTRVLQTYIDGTKVFDLGNNIDRLYQTGGFPLEPSLRPDALRLISAPRNPKTARAPRGIQSKGKTRDLIVYSSYIHPVSQKTIPNGLVHIRNGKIVYVGPRKKYKIPAKARVLTAASVTPGLIDTHSTVPMNGQYNISADQDGDEGSGPNQADIGALDGFNPAEPLLRFLLSEGVTVIHSCPGRYNVIAGSSGVFRTHGNNAEKMAIRYPQAVVFNLGEFPKDTYDGKPGTRMGTAAMIRNEITKAANYIRKRKAAEKAGKSFDRDLKLEALASALQRKSKALFCAQRADDLQTAMRLISEFKMDGQLALAAEGYLIKDQIKKSGLPVIVHPTMQRVGYMETYNSYLGNAATLANSGTLLSICSGFEGYVPKTRVIRHEAAIAAVYGLGFDRALKAITLDAAKILNIDDRYGSLEKGKAADLVLFDGDPFEHTTHVTAVIIDGKVVFDRQQTPRLPMHQMLFMSLPPLSCCLGL